MASYNEIRAQIAALEKQAAQARAAEIEKALTTVRSLIKEHGLSIADIGKKVFADGGPKKASGAKPAKYRDPATGATWSGYGKRPRWIADAMRDGRGDEYLIVRSAAKDAKPAAKAVKAAAAKKPGPKRTAAKTAK